MKQPTTPTGKKAFKEKIVIFYDDIFKGEDICKKNPHMWDELFLLKVKVQYLEEVIDSLGQEDLLKVKNNINELFSRCCQTLKEDHQIKVVNALQTLCVLMQCVFKKKFSEFGFDVINVLVGFDEAESQMQKLVECCNTFLVGDYSVSLKNLTLKLLLIIVTAVDNVSQNTVLEYLMINTVFDSLSQILADPTFREEHGHESVLLLTILVAYRKHEASNPYVIKLSILDDELSLNGLGLVISDVLSRCNRRYAARRAKEQPSGSFFSSITSFVGNMFVAQEDEAPSVSSGNDAVLLALYEAVHSNRNFFTVLSHVMSNDRDRTESDPKPLSPHVIDRPAPIQNELEIDESTIDEIQSENLLATFLRFTSISLLDTKSKHGVNTSRLCLTILNCIVEDQYANAFLHDSNMTFTVPIYKMNLYHRKVGLEAPKSQPLACTLLDLMVEYAVTHMTKIFPVELYKRSIGIIHRCLCYQKRCRIRLQYSWKSLWTALMNLLKFIVSNESTLIPKYNQVFDLAIQVVNIFNLFITYGDTFLPSPTSYDELYYEIIRVHQIFDNLYSVAMRYVSGESEMKASATKLSSCLVNVRAIIHHFAPKIDSWSVKNSKSALTEEEVLEVIRCNYETLTLKLMESLDTYVKYSELPNEASFFTSLVRTIISRVRGSITVSDLQQLSVLQEFSSIT